jgi:hypothetical protein
LPWKGAGEEVEKMAYIILAIVYLAVGAMIGFRTA